jgi:hypothetical protein
LDVASVFFVRAVRKIQAGDVHAKPQQVAQDGLRIRRRADGCYDFRTPRIGVAAFRPQVKRAGSIRFASRTGYLAGY